MNTDSLRPQWNAGNLIHGVTVSSVGEHSGVRVLIGGDLAPVGAGERILAGDEAEAFWLPLADVVGAHDIRIANLECALTNSSQPIVKAGPTMRASPACAKGIRTGGFDILTIANNHAFDMGSVGLRDTLNACHEAGIRTVGAGGNIEKACEPLIVEHNGLRLGIISVAEREFGIAGRDLPGVAPVDPILNATQIQIARASADVVIAIVHGGLEYFALPRPGLVKYCRFLVDCGANAVVCHHTHVASALEVYRGAPISYGVGNFVFDKGSRVPTDWHVGYLMSLNLHASGVSNFRIVPYEQFGRVAGVVPMDESASLELATHLTRLSAVLRHPEVLERQWRTFCRSRRPRYVLGLRAPFLFKGMTGLFKRLPRLSRVLMPRSRRTELLAYMRCDSHREAIEAMLEDLADEDLPIEASRRV